MQISTSALLVEHGEHGVVQATVRGERAAVPGAGLATDRGEPAAGLLDDRDERREVVRLHVELGGDVDEPFGEQHVRPQVAVGPVAPNALGQLEQAIKVAGVAPLGDALEAERGIREVGDLRDRDTPRLTARVIRPRPSASGRPPASTHRRR
jgi:hypothetical protein